MKVKTNSTMKNLMALLGAMLAVAALLVAPAVADTYLIESTDKDGVHYYEYFDYIEENATTPSHSQNGGYSSSGYDKSMAYNGVELELDYFDDTPSSHEHDGIVFTPWTSTTSLPRSAGSYYLTDDVDLDYDWYTPDGHTNLCLNGHSITTNYDERAVYVINVEENSSLNLYDSSVARTGKIAGGKEVKHDDNITYSGGGVVVSGNFTMYGGAISDNLGDGVSVSPSGTFVMVDGIISNNTATHTAGVGVGGTFIMMGGIISDNVAESVSGGVTTGYWKISSSLYTGSFVMLGGTITRNSANKSSSVGGVCIQGTSNSSDVGMFPAGEFILGGGVVTENFAAGVPSNVCLAKDVTITCIQESEIEAGTNIGVTTQTKPYVNNPVAITGQNVGDYSQYFFADNEKYRIENRNNVLYLVSDDSDPSDPEIHEHDGITFSEWTSTTSLPQSAGNYYLKNDVTIDKTWSVPAGTTNLCLDGHKVRLDAEYGCTIYVPQDRTLNLYDPVGSGIIISGMIKKVSDTSIYPGCGVQVKGTFTQYGGTILGNSDGQSSGVSVISGGSFTLVNGTIKNHINIVGSGVNMTGCGVQVYNGTFIQTGGLITGNVGHSGAGVDVTQKSTFIMRGGAITNNSAWIEGGGVRLLSDSNFIMYDGVIAGNTAETGNGGGLEIFPTAKAQLLGGVIKDNCAESSGGILVGSRSDVVMSNITICNNTAQHYGGVRVAGNLTMSGGNIVGNTAEYYGGGVSVSNNGNFVLNDGYITGNTGEYGSAGVDVGLRGNFEMNGGRISHNTAGRFGGGGVGINGGTFTMNGGVITENTAIWNGGGVIVKLSHRDAATEFILSGGVIDGNFKVTESSPAISTASNVHIYDFHQEHDLKLTIADGGLKSGTWVGVSSSTTPTEDNQTAITGQNNADYSSYFFADDEGQSVIDIDGILYLAISEEEDIITPTADLPPYITLQPGWNFVSLPKHLASECNTAGELFESLAATGVSLLGYDAATGWYTLPRDTVLQPLDGYWVFADEQRSVNVTFVRKAPATPTKSLSTGWNAVGICASEPVQAKTAFVGLNWVRYLPWNLADHDWGTPIVKGGSSENSEELSVTLLNGGWLYVQSSGTYIGDAS